MSWFNRHTFAFQKTYDALALVLLLAIRAIALLVFVVCRFCIGCNNALIISKDNLSGSHGNYIVRHDWSFSSAARRINYKSRNCKYAGVSSKTFHYLNALAYRSSEVF